MNIPSTYRLIEKRRIDELAADGYLLEHIKTGARVLCISCEDDNKVFSIGFRTTPKDSTGVAHIIEHTVLCGSDKYPSKDPFVELAKGSLNTFLNAMTYPDKTVYPVASCNYQDFKNLMSVYMDAVFNPNIYKTRTFFEQEGWHYELADADSPLIYNGVVYNEMKGAYSSPDDVLGEEIKKALYPDNEYAHDSGGEPNTIPQLTYENYIDFHRTYYHPSNSYIFLYGNCDMEERLTWIDSEYLSGYGRISVDSAVALQKAPEAPVYRVATYSITDEESEKKNTFLSWNRVTGEASDVLEGLAFSVLEYVLMDAPGAPIKLALMKAGIGSDVYGGYNDGLRQPYFGIIAREADKEDESRFEFIINDVLSDIVENGINKRTVLAGLNSLEFRMREADYGGLSKGLIAGLNAMNTWLYDDNGAFDMLCYQQYFDKLRTLIDEGYFEKLIKEKLLDNPHGATVVMVPEKGKNDKNDAETARKLAELKASLSREQIAQIVEHTAALKKFQETPSTPEELEKIPLLSVDDVSKKAEQLYIDEKELDGIKVIHSDVFSAGIAYFKFSFDARSIGVDDVKYASLLVSLLFQMSTEDHSYEELGDEILIKTGGLRAGAIARVRPEGLDFRVEISGKAFSNSQNDAMELISEVVNTTSFADRERLHNLIMMGKSRLSSTLVERGNGTATVRAAGTVSGKARIDDMISGIDYYEALDNWDKNFDSVYEELAAKLTQLCKKVFVKENMIISFTGSAEEYESFKEAAPVFTDTLPAGEHFTGEFRPVLLDQNEGFKSSSQVNYVGLYGNPIKESDKYKYTGALRVLGIWMGYEYLWINIRVMGGAYGCGCVFMKRGGVMLSSYRDPNLADTLEVFRKAADAVRNLDFSERDMTKYILGAVNELDSPKTPAQKGSMSFEMWMAGITQEDLQRERDEVLTADIKTLRGLADYIDTAVSQNHYCVVGNASAIDAASELFDRTINIFK